MKAQDIIAELEQDAIASLPELIALARAVLDAIERRQTPAAAASVIDAELAAVEAAADVAEAKKVGP